MKNYRSIFILSLILFFARERLIANPNLLNRADNYETSVTFPAGYAIGDYFEFVKVQPLSAGASGFYEISITYTRGNIAAAATHIAAISHADPNIWKETGCTNRNKYVDLYQNFTIDCNAQYGNARFRIRATNTYGVADAPLIVYIKIRSVNFNESFTPLSATGNDLTVNQFLPMTNEWELYVGNLTDGVHGAAIAIKALANGNVGIGTASPKEKLSVNGNIRAREVKVEQNNWPDYVFTPTYPLTNLPELESYIKANKHLPDMPSAREVEAKGISISEMMRLQQQKIEELTLHLIEQDKQLSAMRKLIESCAKKRSVKDK